MHESTVVYRDPTAWDAFQAILDAVPLPRGVQLIAEVIGREPALKLVAELPRVYSRGRPSGQVMLYVPHHLTEGHRLVQILGEEAALKLVTVFAGEVMLLPVCADLCHAFRNQAMEIERARGASEREICKLFCISPSRVRAIKKSQLLLAAEAQGRTHSWPPPPQFRSREPGNPKRSRKSDSARLKPIREA